MWSNNDAGSWTKTVTVSGQNSSVAFQVTVPAACGYTWQANKVFAPDEHYTGCNGTLYMQGDGNLVIYTAYGVPIWASNTFGDPGGGGGPGDGGGGCVNPRLPCTE